MAPGRFTVDLAQGIPIEPRAIVVQLRGDRVTIWTSTQVPPEARKGVAPSGNLCRCTGYDGTGKTVLAASEKLRAEGRLA